MSKNIFIIAGEPSGDHHGARLMFQLKKQNPNITFSGIGGDNMEAEGLKSLFALDQLSVMGFIEVIKHLKFFRTVEATVLTNIQQNPPDRIILIDYPGFNLRITKKIKKICDIPITYYISPQLWAWKSGRIEIIRQYIDQLLVIFPFEKDWYENRGIEVEFVGHPMLDVWKKGNHQELCESLKLDSKKPILTLYPGSRKMEIHNHLGLFIKTAIRLRDKIPDLQVIIGAVPGFDALIPENLQIPDYILIEKEHSKRTLEVASTALVASGTSTVEAAIFGTPMVVVYKLNPVSWLLTRLFVKVKFAGMVNILAGKAIVPELLQSDATVSKLFSFAHRFFTDQPYLEEIKNNLHAVRDSLGGSGASIRAAKAIISRMN
ncbi:MAG: lipid-A-disaccharide synthase [Candidatus Marinimicrobia bacterium]|jgi:lipid-A-disaccharide synthase|nr:lipid-A-disaccharide synthase [Candidatus Neomarinimicrobiota bacterium]MBT3632810.1 lipid-A-disaccharide synthase [Candidatus Neomarinimicrobiota bacterium]MBT3681920.1 lipid-A-disaccharide synthase [Candidatus Neomarinimicrobiota bacterium]MBT3759051.1 lipid-A-disaccharide synthase [Candidatus Neomarinimicrobiota bacterium]MBT3895050.1 lipid-A-disaccharide synthase [Candidatus Neomarinimicrobiota bacterium]